MLKDCDKHTGPRERGTRPRQPGERRRYARAWTAQVERDEHVPRCRWLHDRVAGHLAAAHTRRNWRCSRSLSQRGLRPGMWKICSKRASGIAWEQLNTCGVRAAQREVV